jgi:hypothetical protein
VQADSRVHGARQIVHAYRVGFDEKDVAGGVCRGDHVEVEGDLEAPAGIGRRKGVGSARG